MNAPRATGAQPSVVGSWKLVSFIREEVATGKKFEFFGKHPNGYIVYTLHGRMMALFVHEKRSPPKTDEDRIDLHKHMIAYSGRYAVEGDRVVHHVDVSWIETTTRTNLVRFFKLEGDTLTLKTALAKNSAPGAEVTDVLVFEREREHVV